MANSVSHLQRKQSMSFEKETFGSAAEPYFICSDLGCSVEKDFGEVFLAQGQFLSTI